MTHEEALINILEQLAKLHNTAFETFCSDKVKKYIKEKNSANNIYIKLREHTPQSANKMTSKYYMFDAPLIPIDLRIDVTQLIYQLEIGREPEFYNQIVSDKTAPSGFFIKVDESWNKNYKNKNIDANTKEFIDILLDEKRINDKYKYFNAFINNII